MKQKLGLIILHWLRFWAKIQLRKYAPDVIGITGSAGKTSCRNAVTAILQDKYKLKVTGKANSESGIPLDILGIDVEDYSLLDWLRMSMLAPVSVLTNWQPYEKYVVEMGVDSPRPPKNMDYLLTIIRPRTAIFLNALTVHSQNFEDLGGNMIEQIAKEKGKLIESLPENGLAVINADQPEVIALAKKTKAQVMSFGKSHAANIRIKKIGRDNQGTVFEFESDEGSAQLKLKYLLPDYYGHTLAAALCINADEGNTLEEGCKLLEKNFRLEPGRMSMFEGLNGSIIIDSSYNASAESTIGALKMLAELPAKRRLAVLGPMNELGQETEKETEKVRAQATAICDKVWWSKGNQDAAEIKTFLKPGDYVLVKGSQNGVLLEMTVEKLLKNQADIDKLCRRGKYWDKIRSESRV